MRSTDHKVPCYVVFTNSLSLHPSQAQISSSAPYLRTPSAHVPPSVWHTHNIIVLCIWPFIHGKYPFLRFLWAHSVHSVTTNLHLRRKISENAGQNLYPTKSYVKLSYSKFFRHKITAAAAQTSDQHPFLPPPWPLNYRWNYSPISRDGSRIPPSVRSSSSSAKKPHNKLSTLWVLQTPSVRHWISLLAYVTNLTGYMLPKKEQARSSETLLTRCQ